MADERHGETEAGRERLEEIERLGLRRYVEARDDLVGEHEVRLEQRGARDAHALTLTARKLVRRPVETGEREPDAIEESSHPALGVRAVRRHTMKEERLDQDSPDRMARVERGHRVLENHLHAAPQRPHLELRQLRDVLPVEHDPARIDVDEPHERAAERRLARARFANDADGFAPAYPEVDAMQDFD